MNNNVLPLLAYEYVPDSEIASSAIATSLITGQSGSEEDLLSPKVLINQTFFPKLKIFQAPELMAFFNLILGGTSI